jgi:hypothetical protein
VRAQRGHRGTSSSLSKALLSRSPIQEPWQLWRHVGPARAGLAESTKPPTRSLPITVLLRPFRRHGLCIASRQARQPPWRRSRQEAPHSGDSKRLPLGSIDSILVARCGFLLSSSRLARMPNQGKHRWNRSDRPARYHTFSGHPGRSLLGNLKSGTSQEPDSQSGVGSWPTRRARMSPGKIITTPCANWHGHEGAQT